MLIKIQSFPVNLNFNYCRCCYFCYFQFKFLQIQHPTFTSLCVLHVRVYFTQTAFVILIILNFCKVTKAETAFKTDHYYYYYYHNYYCRFRKHQSTNGLNCAFQTKIFSSASAAAAAAIAIAVAVFVRSFVRTKQYKQLYACGLTHVTSRDHSCN